MDFIKIEKVEEEQEVYGIGTIDFNKITPRPPWVYRGAIDSSIEEKYGADNCWYNWSVNNWGTKWNAYFQPDKRSTEDTIFFTTAWNSPIELIHKLSWIFPNVELCLSWADEDFGYNLGEIIFKDGVTVKEYIPEGGSQEAKEMFFKITQGSPDQYDIEDITEIHNFGKEYNINISLEELEDFKEYLYSSPLLAYKHATGQKIYDALKKHYDDANYSILEISEIVYRGRVRKIDQPKYIDDELWNPPMGVSTHGRYNSIGISVLYCCETIENIPYELYPTKNEVVDIARMGINSSLKLLNIGNIFRGFEGFFDEIDAESKLLKRSYLLPNFVKDCCSAIGYHGVMYQGVRGENYYGSVKKFV